MRWNLRISFRGRGKETFLSQIRDQEAQAHKIHRHKSASMHCIDLRYQSSHRGRECQTPTLFFFRKESLSSCIQCIGGSALGSTHFSRWMCLESSNFWCLPMLSSMKIEALGSRKRNSSAMRRLKTAPWREIVLFWSHCKTWFIGEKSGKKKKKRVGYLYFRLCFSSCVYFHEINTHCIRIPVSFVGCCVLFFWGEDGTFYFVCFIQHVERVASKNTSEMKVRGGEKMVYSTSTRKAKGMHVALRKSAVEAP